MNEEKNEAMLEDEPKEIIDHKITLKSDTRQLLFSKSALLSFLALWGIQQSPYDYPKNLLTVLDKFSELLDKDFTQEIETGGLWFMKLARKELYTFIDKRLMSIPAFKDWNLSEVERQKGIGVDDPERPSFVGISRFDIGRERDPDVDFIDLEAVVQNMVRSVQKSQA